MLPMKTSEGDDFSTLQGQANPHGRLQDFVWQRADSGTQVRFITNSNYVRIYR